jgi:hypothetical protein
MTAASPFIDRLALPFVLLGVKLATRTVTLLTNTDRIEVTPQQLKIRSGPPIAWDAIGCTLPIFANGRRFSCFPS